jgi:hypothetical protein
VDEGGVAVDVARNRDGRVVFRYGCASLLALVGAVVLCCGLVVTGSPESGDTPALAATPTPIDGSVVLLFDGRTILYSNPSPCRFAGLGATETPTQVSLSLRERDGGPLDCVGSSADEPHKTVLASHLGARTLVDQATGMAVPYFDQSRGLRLVVGQTPWASLTYEPRVVISTYSPYFGGPGAAVMVQTFSGFDPRGPYPTFGRVQIIEVSGGGWNPPPATVTTPLTVRGHAGLAAAGIIVWTEAGLTVAVVATLPPPPQPTAPPYVAIGGPVPAATLISIASALTGGGS